LGHLKDIISDKSNWPAFEDTFGRQANVTKRFTDFIIAAALGDGGKAEVTFNRLTVLTVEQAKIELAKKDK